MSTYSLEETLRRGAATSVRYVHQTSESPGVYAVYCDVGLTGIGWDAASGPMYVGKADDGLRGRLKTHMMDTGRSTLRRSLGALLRVDLDLEARPRASRGEPTETSFQNYTFGEAGDRRLTNWMLEHLVVAASPIDSPTSAEGQLLAKLRPPLNLTKWPNPWRSKMLEARKYCADQARRSVTGASG